MRADEKTYVNRQNHDFARCAIVVPRVYLANPQKNAREHLRFLEELEAQAVDYALYPELSLIGYSTEVLRHQVALLEDALDALYQLVEWSSNKHIIFSVGTPFIQHGMLFNCGATICRGRILGMTPKKYLAEGRNFFEEHYFAPADEANFTEISLFDDNHIRFGTNIIIQSPEHPLLTIHTSVCEDDFVSISPGTLAALNGALVKGNLSGSNFSVGKVDYREQQFTARSGFDLCAQMYASAGFGESTTDHSWDGQIMFAERGYLVHSSTQRDRDGHYVIHDVDLLAIQQDRLQQRSFQKNARDFKMPFRFVEADPAPLVFDMHTHSTLRRTINPLPFVPADPEKRDIRCREMVHAMGGALATRILSLPENVRKPIIGVSGGLDSALALMITIAATDELGLDRKDVIAVTMDGFGTDPRTRANALQLIKVLGVSHHDIDIKPSARLRFETIDYDPDMEGEKKSTIFENVQASERTRVLEALGWKLGGFVINTSDLSERAIGWCTYLADHAGHYAVNCGVPKTLVGFLLSWIAEVRYGKDTEIGTTLLDIIATPPTPGLQPLGPGGLIVQKTDDIVGPIVLRDFFLYYMGHFGFPPFRIVWMAEHAFTDTAFDVPRYKRKEIVHWFRIFITRFFMAQFKRSMSPDGPKMGFSDSPRGEWRAPSDADPSVWLEDLDRVPL